MIKNGHGDYAKQESCRFSRVRMLLLVVLVFLHSP